MTFGNINTSSLISSSSGSVTNSLYSNQATFNTSDNCYYVFEYGNTAYTGKLHKITIGGTVTTYTNGGGTQATVGLVYNPVTNKLYCLQRSVSGVGSVAEVTLSGSSYIVTPIASAPGTAGWVVPTTSTVDNGTGDVYFAMSDATYTIAKYHPGATSTTVVTSGTGGTYMGLRFNPNDNMLYAIKETPSFTVADEFVKITPAGTVSTLATLPFSVNPDFYSTTLDRCSNRYILSTHIGSPTTNVVVQVNMSGTIVQTDTTAGLYQGLDILY
jgi:hypothetical protein